MTTPIQQSRSRLIAKVHIAKQQLGLDDATYRSVLEQVTGKTSAAKLRPLELHNVIKHFETVGFKSKKPSKRRMSPPSGTGQVAEVDKIRAIWITMAKQGFVRDGSEAALDAYVKRMSAKFNRGKGIESVSWLTDHIAAQILESIKNWHRRLMADWLVKQGINVLQGHRKEWPTAKAPYAYVSAAYAELIKR
ncbi:gp16 family protein [Neptunicella sp. SCSIO 80796]|uniref:gp16 family protein n=1 Tax=Neptunicella plasticusilytica TaxID=3117012 RepID=UPI003A4DD3BC